MIPSCLRRFHRERQRQAYYSLICGFCRAFELRRTFESARVACGVAAVLVIRAPVRLRPDIHG